MVLSTNCARCRWLLPDVSRGFVRVICQQFARLSYGRYDFRLKVLLSWWRSSVTRPPSIQHVESVEFA